MSKLLEFNYRCLFVQRSLCFGIVVFSVLHRGKSTRSQIQVYKCASHVFLETKIPTCFSLTRKQKTCFVFCGKSLGTQIDSLDFLEVSVFYEAKNKSSTQQVEPTYVVIFKLMGQAI